MNHHGVKDNQLQLWQLCMIVFLKYVLFSWLLEPTRGGVLAQINAEGKTTSVRRLSQKAAEIDLTNCVCWWKQVSVCAQVVPEKKDFYGWGIPRAFKSRREGRTGVHVEGTLKRIHGLIRDMKWKLRIGRCKTEGISSLNKCLSEMKNRWNTS